MLMLNITRKVSLNLIFAISLSFCAKEVMADSPLTSTVFYGKCFKKKPEIEKYLKLNGKIDKRITLVLTDQKITLWNKIELINGLGWSGNGRDNHKIFLNHLIESKEFKDSLDFMNNSTPEILICFSYMKAMDNYFDVKDALTVSKMALDKKGTSETITIVNALIESQHLTTTYQWHLVSETFNTKINKEKLTEDKVCANAVTVIKKYIDMYTKYTKS